ncbi:MAG: hypothetical protein GW858_02585 [Sphingomonadales bacterium]|nr:hypothetical protein [Sphingomonadales bacterium]NCQ20297.1 hypothetical protein [Sphingomonadales bacterium]NCT02844.1 hypothetical protein [Sphingomonadales bacterium]
MTAAFIGCAAFPAAAAYNGTDSYQDLANTTLECATAMQYSEDHGEPLRFSSAVLFDEFRELEREHGVSREVAATWAKEQFDSLTANMTQSQAEDYIYDTAALCEELTIEREDRRIAAERQQAHEQGGEINVPFLREHFAANRNPRLIADYIVDRHPGGKGRMGDPIPEGEYLGELVVEIGKLGVQALSDAAIVAMITDPYWQYNPPATRLATEEYQRRLRVLKFNQRDAQAWAGRVQAERRSEMQSMAARSAERWGSSVKCTNVAPKGLEGKSYTSCRTLDRYGQ